MFDWNKEYETLDEIPEGARDAFEERDGKYALIKALSKTGLQSTLDKQKKEITELKAFKKKFEVLDLTDEQIESLHDDLDELQSLRDLKESGQLGGDELEKRAKELVDARLEVERKKFERAESKLKADLDAANQKLGETTGKLKTVSLETQARALAVKYKIAGHSIDDALYHVGRSFDLDEDGNVVDKSDAGRSLDDWFAETVPNKPGWTFDPTAGGSGAEGGKGRTTGVQKISRAEFDKKPHIERDAIMKRVQAKEAELVD